MPSLLEVATSTKRRKVTKKLAAAGKLAAQQMLLQELEGLERQAHDLGLHVTGHALNRAKNALGWEMAGEVVTAGKAARGEWP